jgi:Ran GTPase-activating protein (RanGAP) involved in mRNA processing and transport
MIFVLNKDRKVIISQTHTFAHTNMSEEVVASLNQADENNANMSSERRHDLIMSFVDGIRNNNAWFGFSMFPSDFADDESANQKGTEYLEQICDALSESKSVRDVHVACRQLNKTLQRARNLLFAKALKKNTSILTAHWADCLVDDEAAAAIGDMLYVNKTLQTLFLHQNAIGDAGAVAIAEGMQHNVGLLQLDLDSNRFSASLGGAALGDMLENYNYCLNSITLDDRTKDVETYCQRNKDLKWIRIRPLLVDFCLAFTPMRLPSYVYACARARAVCLR